MVAEIKHDFCGMSAGALRRRPILHCVFSPRLGKLAFAPMLRPGNTVETVAQRRGKASSRLFDMARWR